MEFISYIFVLISSLGMVGLGLALPLLVLVCYYRMEYGVVLISFIWMVDAFSMGVGGIHLGIFLSYTDLALIPLAAIAMLRFLFANDFPLKHWAWVLFCAVFCVSLLTGLLSFGTAAGVQARGYFYFIVATLYSMSFPVDVKRLRFIFNTMVVCALVLVLLCIYRWIVYYTPIHSLLPIEGSYNIDGPMRVVRSMEALVIAQVLVLGIFFTAAARGVAVAKMLSPLLLVMVLALQHRSVWLATIFGVATQLFISRLRGTTSGRQLSVFLLMGSLVLLPLLMSHKISGIGNEVSSSLVRGLSGEGTVSERANSWKEIINKWYSAGPKSILIGQSFGSDNTRYVLDSHNNLRKINYQAHNLYVQTLWNTGLVGLFAFLAANAFVVTGLYRALRQGVGGVEVEVLMVLIIMQLIYYIPYGTDFLQSMILGVALAYVVRLSSKAELGQVNVKNK